MRDSTIVDNDITYIEYGQNEFDVPAQQVITGTAITSLNGLTGPNVNSVGGTSGFSYSPSGITIILVSPLTTKGDIYTHDATNGSRLAVGTDGQVLTADSASTNGIKWAAGASSTSLPVLNTQSFSLNNAAAQTLYTVPPGKSAIVTFVVGRAPSVDLSGGTTTFLTFGFNAGANDWSTTNNYSTTALTSATFYQMQSQEVASGNGPAVIGTAGQAFKAIVDAAFGSAATLTISVLGYEF
jgi:hypothetical protein